MRLGWRPGNETGVSGNEADQRLVTYSNLWRSSTENNSFICTCIEHLFILATLQTFRILTEMLCTAFCSSA